MGGSGLQLGMRVKQSRGGLKLESGRLFNRVENAEKTALRASGGYIRLFARRSMKRVPMPGKRKMAAWKKDYQAWVTGGKEGLAPPFPSAPPSPKNTPPRARLGLVKLIAFAYEPNRRSVVVGPIKLRKTPGDTLEMLEYGGTTTRHGRTARYPARPFMEPARQAEEANVIARWRNSLK